MGNKIASKYFSKDSKIFWEEIQKMNGSDKNAVGSTVNGVSGYNNSYKMWTFLQPHHRSSSYITILGVGRHSMLKSGSKS